VRGADVLPLPVPGVSRNVELDLLQQSAVRLHAFSDVWDVVPSRFCFLNCYAVFSSISTYSWYAHGVHSFHHHRDAAGRSPSITLLAFPSIRMNISFFAL